MHRKFWYVAKGDIDQTRLWGCRTVVGTRRIHSIYGFDEQNPLNIKVRDFSCFCDSCMNLQFDMCDNLERFGAWKPVTLEPIEDQEVCAVEANPLADAVAFEEGDEPDFLAECVELGDQFAVRAEEENEKKRHFFILKCTKVKYTVEERLRDPWNEGNFFEPGFSVIAGTYYQQFSKSNNLYVLLDDMPPGIVESHLVRYLKFPMQPKRRINGDKPTFDVAYDVCLQACEQRADFDGTESALPSDYIECDS